jgi:lysophospholipase L1-like esterase
VEPQSYEELDDKEKVGADPAQYRDGGSEEGRRSAQAAGRRREMRSGSHEGSSSSFERSRPSVGRSRDALATQRLKAAEERRQQERLKDPNENPNLMPTGFDRLKGTLRKRRRIIIGSTVAGGIVTMLLTTLAGLLPVLKLDFAGKNIEDVRMARMKYMFDRRSDRFINTLVMAEVAGADDSGTNRYFQAKGWSTSHPFTQWFRDMKTNKVMERIAKEKGYIYARDAKDRLVRISINGEDVDFKEIIDGLQRDGGLSDRNLAKFELEIDKTFGTHKAANAALRADITNVTKRREIINRHFVRGWARERLGILRWKFFDKDNSGTDKEIEKKVRLRWTKQVSGKLFTGAFTKCLLGGDCSKTSNLNDEDNWVKPGDIDTNVSDSADEAADESEGATEVPHEGPNDPGIFGRIMANKLVQKAIPIVNIGDWLSTIVGVDNAFGKDGILNTITNMRMAEYATSYLTLRSMTDDIKNGKGLGSNSKQVGAVMKMWNGMEKSDAYNALIASQSHHMNGYTPASPPKGWAKVTDNLKMVSDGTKAAKITQIYKNTAGRVITPILDLGVGPVTVRRAVEIGGAVLSTVISPVSGFIASHIPGRDAIESKMTSILADVYAWMGGSSACAGEHTGGMLLICADAGGMAVQEAFLQYAGGRPLSDAESHDLNTHIAMAQEEEDSQKSGFTRIASLSDNRSVLARLIMATPTTTGEAGSRFASTLSKVVSPKFIVSVVQAPINLFTQSAEARPIEMYDSDIYGDLKHYGCSEEEIDNTELFGGLQSQTEVDDAIDTFEGQLKDGKDPDLDGDGKPDCNMAGIDNMAATSIGCIFNDDPNCGGIPEEAANIEQNTCQVVQDGGSRSLYVLGDSIMEGAVNAGALEDKLNDKHLDATVDASVSRSLTGPGISGNKLSGLDALNADKDKVADARLILIELGTNTSGSKAQFETQVNTIISNIRTIEDNAHKPHAPIYWANIFSLKDPATYGDYNAVLQQMDDDNKIKVIDTTKFGIPLDGEKLHPNGAAAYKTYATKLAAAIDDTTCVTSVGAVAGDRKELAQQILDKSKTGKITFQTICGVNVKDYVQATARGEKVPVPTLGGSVYIDERLLKIILQISDSGARLNISTFTNCTHSSINSAHYTGKAVDIGNSGFGNEELTKIQHFLYQNRSSLDGLDQVIWRGPSHEVNHQLDDAKPVGDSFYTEHEDHLHIGVK